jgi:hypothetical protein
MIGIAVATNPQSISGCTNFIGAAKITGARGYSVPWFGKMVNQKEWRKEKGE